MIKFWKSEPFRYLAPFGVLYVSFAFGAILYDNVPKKGVLNLSPHRLEQKLYKKKYEKAWEQLFGREGLPDLNKDGILDLHEQKELRQRMGYKSLILEGRDNFNFQSQKPTLKQLEQAVRSYESSY